jgi:hypothetical protein
VPVDEQEGPEKSGSGSALQLGIETPRAPKRTPEEKSILAATRRGRPDLELTDDQILEQARRFGELD